MNLLVIGGGGREHALCWKLRQSARVEQLWCAPGNAGIASVAECVTLADEHALIAFAYANDIGLVLVGPEGPLVAGLVDALRTAGIRAFGPTAAAAQLEGSKAFTKALCARANIPTAAFAHFGSGHAARSYVANHPLPVVIKADGLAAGKGVVIARSAMEASAALDVMTGQVVIEEFLTGTEASLFVLCDGTNIVSIGSAQDFKRAGEGDTGPNTGGMGAVSPAPALTPALERRAIEEIVAPTIAALAAMGTPFTGVLFAGLMLTADGPMLIEYNVRFGDPECEALMVRLDSDLLDLLLATCDGTLEPNGPVWNGSASVTVVMAANGYPSAPVIGTAIAGFGDAEAGGAIVFHAGTGRSGNQLVATGGRALAVTGRGPTVGEARAAAYDAVGRIDWPGGFYRKDIGEG